MKKNYYIYEVQWIKNLKIQNRPNKPRTEKIEPNRSEKIRLNSVFIEFGFYSVFFYKITDLNWFYLISIWTESNQTVPTTNSSSVLKRNQIKVSAIEYLARLAWNVILIILTILYVNIKGGFMTFGVIDGSDVMQCAIDLQ